MKEFFYFQSPSTNQIKGWIGKWRKVNSLQVDHNGPIISTFDKDTVLHLSECVQLPYDNLNFILKDFKPSIEVTKSDYLKIVKDAKDYCKLNGGKIVISRVKKKLLPIGFDPKSFFDLICKTYTHSFNYILYSKELGLWIGASPEKLVEGSGELYNVIALAGSRSKEKPFEWTSKEIAEQQMVVDSIISDLERLDGTYVKGETYTAQAGNLEHLRTDFEVNTREPLKLADTLHPTPAVSGLPKQAAIDFIGSNEKHNRSLYTGVVGCITKEETKLFVNLRCARINKNEIELFVGGGITSESIPENEWEETEIKSQTLLAVM